MPAPQTILLITSIIALLVAIAFAIMAVRTYFVLEIRLVMDDLAGKSHGASSSATTSATRRAARRGRSKRSDEALEAVKAAVKSDKEDETATVLDSMPAVVAQRVPIAISGQTLSSASTDHEDMTATAVTHGDEVDNTPTEVAGSSEVEQAQQSTMPARTQQEQAAFTLVKRIVILHSNDVLVIGWEKAHDKEQH